LRGLSSRGPTKLLPQALRAIIDSSARSLKPEILSDLQEMSLKLLCNTPLRLTNQYSRHRVRNRQTRPALQPKPLAAGVDFENHMTAVGRKDKVGGAVVEAELRHHREQTLLDLRRKRVLIPVVNQADAIPAPIDFRRGRALRIDRRREHPSPDDCGA